VFFVVRLVVRLVVFVPLLYALCSFVSTVYIRSGMDTRGGIGSLLLARDKRISKLHYWMVILMYGTPHRVVFLAAD